MVLSMKRSGVSFTSNLVEDEAHPWQRLVALTDKRWVATEFKAQE